MPAPSRRIADRGSRLLIKPTHPCGADIGNITLRRMNKDVFLDAREAFHDSILGDRIELDLSLRRATTCLWYLMPSMQCDTRGLLAEQGALIERSDLANVAPPESLLAQFVQILSRRPSHERNRD